MAPYRSNVGKQLLPSVPLFIVVLGPLVLGLHPLGRLDVFFLLLLAGTVVASVIDWKRIRIIRSVSGSRSFGQVPAFKPLDPSPPASEIVHKAIAFSEKSVGEVMVPRPEMCCVRADATLAEVLELAGRTTHTRLPVYEGDLDHILGFIHAKDLIKLVGEREPSLVSFQGAEGDPEEPRARDLMRPVLAVPENKAINDMLRTFQQQKTHVAIVFDEFGGTAGMVTINDLLEELVGELFDEWTDGDPEVEPLANGTVRLNGRVAIDEVNKRFGLALPIHEFNTIAGLVFGCLGRTPVPGDEAEIGGTRFRVEATNGRRATQILLIY